MYNSRTRRHSIHFPFFCIGLALRWPHGRVCVYRCHSHSRSSMLHTRCWSQTVVVTLSIHKFHTYVICSWSCVYPIHTIYVYIYIILRKCKPKNIQLKNSYTQNRCCCYCRRRRRRGRRRFCFGIILYYAFFVAAPFQLYQIPPIHRTLSWVLFIETNPCGFLNIFHHRYTRFSPQQCVF